MIRISKIKPDPSADPDPKHRFFGRLYCDVGIRFSKTYAAVSFAGTVIDIYKFISAVANPGTPFAHVSEYESNKSTQMISMVPVSRLVIWRSFCSHRSGKVWEDLQGSSQAVLRIRNDFGLNFQSSRSRFGSGSNPYHLSIIGKKKEKTHKFS